MNHLDPSLDPSPNADGWYVELDNDLRLGPMSFTQLAAMARAAKLSHKDRVLNQAANVWVTADCVPDLFESESSKNHSQSRTDLASPVPVAAESTSGLTSVAAGSGSSVPSPPQPWKMPSNPFLYFIGLALACVALVEMGIIPVSVAKRLPLLKNSYRSHCEDCNGVGKVNPSCAACNGRGFFGGQRCFQCAGKGRIEQRCPFCAGSGRVPTK